MDPFLVVAFVIIILVSIVVNVYVVAYWQSPYDKHDSYYAKAIVVSISQMEKLVCVFANLCEYQPQR